MPHYQPLVNPTLSLPRSLVTERTWCFPDSIVPQRQRKAVLFYWQYLTCILRRPDGGITSSHFTERSHSGNTCKLERCIHIATYGIPNLCLWYLHEGTAGLLGNIVVFIDINSLQENKRFKRLRPSNLPRSLRPPANQPQYWLQVLGASMERKRKSYFKDVM